MILYRHTHALECSDNYDSARPLMIKFITDVAPDLELKRKAWQESFDHITQFGNIYEVKEENEACLPDITIAADVTQDNINSSMESLVKGGISDLNKVIKGC